MIDKYNDIECNGCQMCKEICTQKAISYQTDTYGFWKPHVDYEKCSKCGLCVKRCPNKNLPINSFNQPIVKAVWSIEDEVRLGSTSGGAFYEFARKILCEDGYVVGCVYDEDFKGAHHVIIHSMEELKPLMVSKYVESSMEGIYPQIKEAVLTGKPVLFVGAPCQCGGLISYLNKRYENLIIMDFLCRGANSPKAHRHYIEYLEDKYESKMINLRSKDKRNGWEQFGQSATFANGKEYFAHRSEDLRVVAYHYGNLMVRESCLDCKFKTLPRYSDLTLGDFWGIKKEEVDDIDKGVSLLFINSEKGMELFDSITDRVVFINKTLEDAKRGNPAIYQSATCSKNREEFLAHLDDASFDVLVARYRDYPPKGMKLIYTKVKSKMKSIVKKFGGF